MPNPSSRASRRLGASPSAGGGRPGRDRPRGVLASLVTAALWASAGRAGPTPVTPERIITSTCFGWSTRDDTAYVARQKERCTPEDGCTLGASLARVGPRGGAHTVAPVGRAERREGPVALAAVLASVTPSSLEKANTVLTAEADAGCETYAEGVPFQLGGQPASVGVVNGVATLTVGGRAVPVDALSTGAVTETLEAVHLAPGGRSAVLRILSRADGLTERRFVHVGARRLGLEPAAPPEVAPAPPAPSTGADAPLQPTRWPLGEQRCLGWSADGAQLYTLRDTLRCDTDDQCEASTVLVEVGRDGARILAPLTTVHADAAAVGAAWQAPVAAERLSALNGLVNAQLGCATGRSGALSAGHRFTVRSAAGGDLRAVWLRVDDGTETQVATLTVSDGSHEGEAEASIEELLGVYSHPELSTLVLEIRQRTARGLSSRYVRVEGPALTLAAPRRLVQERPDDALRHPRLELSLPLRGRRCLGWSTRERAVYMVLQRDYCADASGSECTATLELHRVDAQGDQRVAVLSEARADAASLQERLTQNARPERIAAALTAAAAHMDVGCVTSATGMSGGAQFRVDVSGREVQLGVEDAPPSTVLRLEADAGDDRTDHRARYSVSAVYSHPDVPLVAIELEAATDRGTDRAVRLVPLAR